MRSFRTPGSARGAPGNRRPCLNRHRIMEFAFGFLTGFVTAAGLALLWLLGKRRGTESSVPEVRRYLEEFLRGDGNPYDWDDFLSIPIRDPYLDSIRNRSNRLQGDYPPVEPGHWCSPEGEKILRRMIDELKQHEVATPTSIKPEANKAQHPTA